MPLVKVQYRQGFDDTGKLLADHLPLIVAEALTCNNVHGELTARDIEVETALLPITTSGCYEIQITIDANEYPERRADLDERQKLITEAVRRLCHDYGYLPRGFVWVRLFPASFGEF